MLQGDLSLQTLATSGPQHDIAISISFLFICNGDKKDLNFLMKGQQENVFWNVLQLGYEITKSP